MGTKMTELVDVPALEERETHKIKVALKLYTAAALGNVAALEEMLNQKTNVFIQVCHGRNTALHISAYHGRRAFVERLLQLIREKSDEEATNEDRGRSLLIAGNNEGNTALHEAVRGVGDAEIVKVLIKADEALAGISNKKGQTCLHVAAAQGHVAVVRSILRSETNCMEIRDKEGRTALHYAVEHAKIRVVIVLVKAMGMLINTADKEGCTALDIANQKYEEEPLSPYFAIQLFLRGMNAVAGMKDANKIREEPSKANKCETYSKRLNILSVCAIFIATVTFQAAFTVPHRLEDNEHPDPLTMTMLSAPMSTVVYRALGDSGIFLIFDALAFVLSIVTIIILAYVHILCRYRSRLVVAVAIILPFALNTMIYAFSFAILIQLGSERYVVASIINYAMVFVGLLLFAFLPIAALTALGIFGLLTFLTLEL